MWAALFPGQGSQSVGMGRFLYDNFPLAKQAFEEASDTLSLDFKNLCFEDPDGALAFTENTQPALLLVSTATYRTVAQNVGIDIRAGAGHSIGEYAALVTSGSISFADGLRAVRARGVAMQKAVPIGEGAMIAVIGLDDDQVIQLCAWAEKESGLMPMEPANFNSPGQVVISGSAALGEWIRAHAPAYVAGEKFISADGKPARMKLIPLNVSAPFHCSLMAPAEMTMRRVLEQIEFKPPAWPIVQNFTAEANRDPAIMREHVIRQISGAVRWTQCMRRLKSLKVTRVIEFGHGRVLAGLAKKIDSEGVTPFNVNSLDDIKALEATL